MANKPPVRRSVVTRWLLTRHWWQSVTRPWVRVVLAAVGLAVAGWLVYTNVWVPLHSAVSVPVSNEGTTVQLNTAALDTLNEKRLQRLHASPLPFDESAPRVFGL